MKCFEVVQKVLEGTYEGVPGDETERDRQVRLALGGLSHQYKTALLTKGGPNFEEPATRFAYVYCYVPAHAHWIYELITWSQPVQAVLANKKVRIACIGGGPGSDLVGVLKYLDERTDRPVLFCEIADGCVLWKQTWSDLAFTLDWTAPLHTDYVVQRVGSGSEWTQPNKFNQAEIITLNFFFSEIAHLGAVADSYISQLFAIAKPGALFLFNDNNDTRFYERFDALAKAAGLEVQHSANGTRKVYDSKEQTSELGRFLTKFNHAPRLKGDVASRVLRKP